LLLSARRTAICGIVPGWSHWTRLRKPWTFFTIRGLVNFPNQRKRGWRASRHMMLALPVRPSRFHLRHSP
jgi:hypothetical protein